MGKYKILFIHGAGGTKSKWRAVGGYFKSSQFEVIDLPGHGDNETSIFASIQDYAANIDKAIQEDTIVVGHSMGGLIALELAARSKKVKGVVLAASFYELPVHPKMLEKLENGEYPSSLFYASYNKDISEHLLEEEKQELNQVPIEITYADFNACNQYTEGKRALSSLNIPIYAILGSQDRLLPIGAAESLKNVKSDMKITEIEGSGHYIMLEKPKEFILALTEFVQEVETQTV
ncbi:alpha/beta hydrolase [Bacillus sp. FJAT-29790]|uniref:alpha/beta fold hydrolase n=1 Tax=Bacillus sp. FJAT-29790 TaxID=1895002 RepID=UPI001C21A566|nr:alpha/beta hydrolase [Bacillus sp. FJAT-29790]MBU8879775.1 alpha/beta hydrolase [Bacillus sp. FJAT-29790]